MNEAHKEVCGGMFGYFGTDETRLDYVRQYVAAMEADGWTKEPTYKTENVDRAAKLRREGFVCSVLMRDNRNRPDHKGAKLEVSISMWGPDGLAITPPSPYLFEACVANTRQCLQCGATDVETQRVGFAGRVCAKCHPETARRIETPGWTK